MGVAVHEARAESLSRKRETSAPKFPEPLSNAPDVEDMPGARHGVGRGRCGPAELARAAALAGCATSLPPRLARVGDCTTVDIAASTTSSTSRDMNAVVCKSLLLARARDGAGGVAWVTATGRGAQGTGVVAAAAFVGAAGDACVDCTSSELARASSQEGGVGRQSQRKQ